MGIISTLMLFLGVVAAVYMKCKRNKSKHMYTEIPSSPVTPPPAFPFMTPFTITNALSYSHQITPCYYGR